MHWLLACATLEAFLGCVGTCTWNAKGLGDPTYFFFVFPFIPEGGGVVNVVRFVALCFALWLLYSKTIFSSPVRGQLELV